MYQLPNASLWKLKQKINKKKMIRKQKNAGNDDDIVEFEHQMNLRFESFVHVANDNSEVKFRKTYDKPNTIVGQGAWGVVYDICPKHKTTAKKCQYVLKRINITSSLFQIVPSYFATADLDLQYLRDLRRVKLNKYHIVPRVKQAWISKLTEEESNYYPESEQKCHKIDFQNNERITFYNLLMSKYDGNMGYLTSLRANKITDTPNRYNWQRIKASYPTVQGIYFLSELLRMYRIAWGLGSLGVIHGDLKPDQYLFQFRSQRHDIDNRLKSVSNIAVTDFGFAGRSRQSAERLNKSKKNINRQKTTDFVKSVDEKLYGFAEMGWPSNEKSPSQFGLARPGFMTDIDSNEEAAMMNICFLEAFLICDGVNVPTIAIKQSGEVCIFTGIRDFTKELALKKFKNVHGWFPLTFSPFYDKCIQHWKHNKHNISCVDFTLSDIK